MFCKKDFLALLCRGRKKKIVVLVIILLLLLNAMFYVSWELYSTVKRKRRDPWNRSLHVDYLPKDEKGMKVIVGHYVGGSKGVNLSDEIINKNNYAPLEGAGEGGRPVQLSQRELISARELYSLHSYNILVSDKISIDRSLPDMRSESCRNIQYNVDNLPTASIIIVFHNEAWSALMRTVMSVVLRSPDKLLKEIILVDDASDRKYLGKELEDAINTLKNVKLLRNKIREGLVGARLLGAKLAHGDVLVFLDAHCEVTAGWIEPLLDRAGSDDVYICPHIDLLSEDTLAYIKSIDAHWGAFSWHLHFRWLMPSKEILLQKSKEPYKPYPTPAMAGGLFAVRKSLFWRLGGYDAGMRIWGAENIELSWRAWQCGARVEITSCSRVGHIFRRTSPYKFPGGAINVLNANLARAATVWMDEWADFVFKFNPQVAAVRDQQSVADRIQLRRNLNCKSFEWYLINVWPQHFFPTKDRWFGRITNERGACIATVPSGTPGLGGPASGMKCGGDLDLETMVVFTPEGQIMADEGLCLEQGNGRAIWKSCSTSKKQIWTQEGPRLKNMSGLCLTLLVNSTDSIGDPLDSKRCEETKGQIWHFNRVPWR